MVVLLHLHFFVIHHETFGNFAFWLKELNTELWVVTMLIWIKYKYSANLDVMICWQKIEFPRENSWEFLK